MSINVGGTSTLFGSRARTATAVCTVLIAAFTFILTYSQHPALPGASATYPLGWFGWYDQGKYLQSAQAFSRHDFSASEHVYPPLYAFLGSFFVHPSVKDPFALIDLLSLVVYGWAFIAFAGRYVHIGAASLVFLFAMVFNMTIFENFVIPWTSTLGAMLFSVPILDLSRADAITNNSRPHFSSDDLAFIGTSFLVGLLPLVRPLDAVVGGVLWLGCLAVRVRAAGSIRTGVFNARYLIAIGILALAVGSISFAWFNLRVYGNMLGGYFYAVLSTASLEFSDLAEKFVSIFLDGYTLYMQPDAPLVSRYPWLAVSMVGVAYALVWGDLPLKTVAAAILVQFVLYLSYSDFTPNSIWRFKLVHYVKWTFPYLLLVAVILVTTAVHSWRGQLARRLPLVAFVLVGSIAIFCLRLRIDWIPPMQVVVQRSSETQGTTMAFEIPSMPISFVDIEGVTEKFDAMYFGAHQLKVNGVELKLPKDYRIIPKPGGVRVLFVRHVTGGRMELHLDPRLTTKDKAYASAGKYRLALGTPAFSPDVSAN
jgi:hypothetical protein